MRYLLLHLEQRSSERADNGRLGAAIVSARAVLNYGTVPVDKDGRDKRCEHFQWLIKLYSSKVLLQWIFEGQKYFEMYQVT